MERNSRLNSFIQEIFGSNRMLILVVILLFLRLLFPGDTGFLNDEAMLFDLALKAHENGELLVNVGLQGTRGFKYGPVGPSFYLYLLYLTKNIYIIIALKNLIISLMTMAGIGLILKRVKDFDRSLWLFLFLSPVLFLYARMLWDNPFLISLTALSMGGYISYIDTFKTRYFALAVIFAVLAVLTHLMVAPLCVALFLHFLIFHHKVIKKNLLKLVAVFLVAGMMLFPYLTHVIENKVGSTLQESVARVFWFPLLGVKFYSFIDFEYFFGKQWERLFFDSEIIFKLLRGTKAIWYLFYLIIPLGWYQIIQHLKSGVKEKNFSIKFHISFLCAVTFIAHLIMCYLSNLYKNTHYYNGVWILHFFVLAFALDKLNTYSKWGKRIKFGYLAAVFIMLVGMVRFNHVHQGIRSRRVGANLTEQVEVAKKLNMYREDTQVDYKTPHLFFAHLSLDILRKLEPANNFTGEKVAPNGLSVDYKDPRHSFQKNGYGFLELKEN
jgi:hypothetical protein